MFSSPELKGWGVSSDAIRCQHGNTAFPAKSSTAPMAPRVRVVEGSQPIAERDLRSARRALRERGEPSELVLLELRRVVRASVRSGTLPAMFAPYGQWDEEAEQDTYQGWLADRLLKNGALQSLLDRARSPAAFRRLAERSLRQWLLNTRERTQAQNLYGRIAALLKEDDAFVCVRGAERPANRWWAVLAYAQSDCYAGTEHQLLRLAHSLGEFELIHYRADSQKHSPLLSHDELLRFVTGLLDAARAPVSLELIARTLTQRFGVRHVSVKQLDEAAEVAVGDASIADQVASNQLARAVIAELSPRQCAVLAGTRAGETLTEMAKQHECSAATVSNEQNRIATVIAAFVDEVERSDLLMIVGDVLYEAGSEP
jgi:hypothetical protein